MLPKMGRYPGRIRQCRLKVPPYRYFKPYGVHIFGVIYLNDQKICRSLEWSRIAFNWIVSQPKLGERPQLKFATNYPQLLTQHVEWVDLNNKQERF